MAARDRITAPGDSAGLRFVRRKLASVFILFLAGLPAGAAPIDVVHWPIPGRPAVALPGGAVEVGLGVEGALALAAGGATYPLTLEATRNVAGVLRGRAVLPEGVPPGVYALVCTAGGVEERRPGAVHVVPAFEASYSVGILSNASLTDAGGLEPVTEEALRQSGVSLAFLIGPFFPPDSPAPYDLLQATLASLPVPVYICPSARELASSRYQSYFGDAVYGVAFGPDGYLMLGDGLAASEPTTVRALGPAYLARRALRPSRWSTGVTARYGLDWRLRGQMALFADDPLDYLMAGSVPEGIGARVPMGPARFVPPPELPLGAFAILEVDDGGIEMRQAPPEAE